MDPLHVLWEGRQAMRSMWTGVISIGMVQIPVKMYAATGQREIALRQVHKDDGGRITLRRVCSVCRAEVPYAEIAKGHELPTGGMVVLTDEDLADLPLATAHQIEVLQFAPAHQVDPAMRARSYYLEPEPAGARSYVLLREALARSGNVAVAHVALRQRQRLAVLRVREGILVIDTLLCGDEVRMPEFAFLGQDIEVASTELRIAVSLIGAMTADFDPGLYRDGYRDALKDLVTAKAERREVIWPTGGQQVAGRTAGLAEALRASLAAARARRAEHYRARP
jgi:DNA end-binding protein Ku